MKKILFSTIKNVEDLEILRDKKVFNYNFDQEELDSLKRNFFLPESLYILAMSGQEFAGFCSIDRDWWEDNYFFLRQILVDPSYRKSNIGSELVIQCINHANKLKAKGVVTETAFENIPMQNLCKKHGFQEWDNPQWKEGITYKLIFSENY